MIEGFFEIIAYDLIGLATGGYLFYKGFGWLKRKRLVEDIPTSKIRSIAMGLVEIKGKAMSAVKMMRNSPFSNKKCVYYKYLVEKLVSSGKSSKWVTISTNYSPEPFYLEDKTGKVMIDPKFAELHVPKSYHHKTGWGKKIEANVINFLNKNDIRFKGRIFGAKYTMKFTEWVITPNMNLYIMGAAGKNPHVESGTASKNEENIIIKKGIDKIMMISSKKEKEVARTLQWKMIGGLVGGGAIMIICTLVLILIIISITYGG